LTIDRGIAERVMCFRITARSLFRTGAVVPAGLRSLPLLASTPAAAAPTAGAARVIDCKT
jgi:hypothetical protein